MTMKKFELTKKEKLMLYGLVKHPHLTDKQLSRELDIKHSTATSIRHRLKEKEYLRKLNIPKLQNMGCEMLVVIYTNFSPLIPLAERVGITGKTIEVFEDTAGLSSENSIIIFTEDSFKIKISSDMFGRVFNSLGKPIDINTKQVLQSEILTEIAERNNVNHYDKKESMQKM